jgi:hypothetical protein
MKIEVLSGTHLIELIAGFLVPPRSFAGVKKIKNP